MPDGVCSGTPVEYVMVFVVVARISHVPACGAAPSITMYDAAPPAGSPGAGGVGNAPTKKPWLMMVATTVAELPGEAVTLVLLFAGSAVVTAAVGATLSVAVLKKNCVGADGFKGGLGGTGMQEMGTVGVPQPATLQEPL